MMPIFIGPGTLGDIRTSTEQNACASPPPAFADRAGMIYVGCWENSPIACMTEMWVYPACLLSYHCVDRQFRGRKFCLKNKADDSLPKWHKYFLVIIPHSKRHRKNKYHVRSGVEV